MNKFMRIRTLGKLILLTSAFSVWAQNIPTINLTSLAEPKENDIPAEAVKTFVDVFDEVRKNHVERVSSQELMENAIRGMLNRLDAHSAYLTPQEYGEFKQKTTGDFAGIGVLLDIKAGFIRVVSTVEGSPATKAGVLSGDIIIQVNGQNVADLSLDDINRLLTGEVGSEVKLLIQRGENMLSVNMLRELIHASSVASRMLTQEFAYLRIHQFQDDTAESLKKDLEILKVKYNLKGLILDLRNNAGGYLESALSVADLFLDAGVIVSVKGRDDADVEIHQAGKGDLFAGLSIVVLIDAGTASAAEILAGALQDNNRALIVGEQSFGKGSVQTLIPLAHGGAIKLTTARYFTPSGRSIQAEGIRPQVQLRRLNIANRPDNPENIRESAFPYHLRNLGEAFAPTEDSQGEALAEQDFALYEALNLLTALGIFNAGRTP